MAWCVAFELLAWFTMFGVPGNQTQLFSKNLVNHSKFIRVGDYFFTQGQVGLDRKIIS